VHSDELHTDQLLLRSLYCMIIMLVVMTLSNSLPHT